MSIYYSDDSVTLFHEDALAAARDLPPEVAEDDAQAYIVGVLDDIRKQGESYQINKPRWMLTARKYKLSYEEIAVVLGMTEGAVRRAINRAKKSPDYVGGA